MHGFLKAAAGVLVAAGMVMPTAAQEFSIMAPAGPGGGWDQTARALQEALQTENLASNVQVVNVPGAGGTIGLAQFVNQQKGNANALIVGGYVMVGAILTNNAPVKLDQGRPRCASPAANSFNSRPSADSARCGASPASSSFSVSADPDQPSRLTSGTTTPGSHAAVSGVAESAR